MINCARCGHREDDHPLEHVGEGYDTSCDLCDCSGMVTPRRINLAMPAFPGELGYPQTPQDMHDVLDAESGRAFGGEATNYYYFTDHPLHGFDGMQLMRGIEGHEVPGHMRSMLQLGPLGEVYFRLSHQGKKNG